MINIYDTSFDTTGKNPNPPKKRKKKKIRNDRLFSSELTAFHYTISRFILNECDVTMVCDLVNFKLLNLEEITIENVMEGIKKLSVDKFMEFINEQSKLFRKKIFALLPTESCTKRDTRNFCEYALHSDDITRRNEEKNVLEKMGNNINEMQDNVELCEIDVPVEIAQEIINFMVLDYGLICSVGLLSYTWFVLILLSWRELQITKNNAMSISLVVLKHSSCKLYFNKHVPISHVQYVLEVSKENSKIKYANFRQLSLDDDDTIKLLKALKKANNTNIETLYFLNEQRQYDSEDYYNIFDITNLKAEEEEIYTLPPYNRRKNVMASIKNLYNVTPVDLFFFDVNAISKLRLVFDKNYVLKKAFGGISFENVTSLELVLWISMECKMCYFVNYKFPNLKRLKIHVSSTDKNNSDLRFNRLKITNLTLERRLPYQSEPWPQHFRGGEFEFSNSFDEINEFVESFSLKFYKLDEISHLSIKELLERKVLQELKLILFCSDESKTSNNFVSKVFGFPEIDFKKMIEIQFFWLKKSFFRVTYFPNKRVELFFGVSTGQKRVPKNKITQHLKRFGSLKDLFFAKVESIHLTIIAFLSKKMFKKIMDEQERSIGKFIKKLRKSIVKCKFREFNSKVERFKSKGVKMENQEIYTITYVRLK